METRRLVASGPAAPAKPDDGMAPPDRGACLVWIDSRSAFVVRWNDGASVLRLESEVPAHHRSTGHVRHDPRVRHGGGGRKQTAGEPHRQEHLKEFLDAVAALVRDEERISIIGPGTVREHLHNRLQTDDERMNRRREIACEPAGRLTERQLIARVRHMLGAEPRRRTVGAYRWTVPPVRRTTGASIRRPRRVVEKSGDPIT